MLKGVVVVVGAKARLDEIFGDGADDDEESQVEGENSPQSWSMSRREKERVKST